MARSVGFVYVLTNPSMPDRVKVGYTTKLTEDRALDLYSSGVPEPFEIAYRTVTSYPAVAERRAHELLADCRVNPKREFFTAEPAQATAAVRQACLDAAGIEAWDSEGPISVRPGDSVALTMRARQLLFPLSFSPTEGWKPVDIWQSHADGDLLHIMAKDSEEHMAGMSDYDPDGVIDPLPHLDRDGKVPNWHPVGRERLRPGQRLLWLDERIDPPAFALFEARSHCQVVSRTESPKLSPEGFPLTLNFFTAEPTATAVAIVNAILKLEPPRELNGASRQDDEPIESREPVDPSYWLPQLEKRHRNSRRSRETR